MQLPKSRQPANLKKAARREEFGNTILMMMVARDGMARQMHRKGDSGQRKRVRESTRCSQQDRMPEASSPLHHVDVHRCFAVSRFKSMQGSQNERELQREGRVHGVYPEIMAEKKASAEKRQIKRRPRYPAIRGLSRSSLASSSVISKSADLNEMKLDSVVLMNFVLIGKKLIYGISSPL